MPVSSMVLVGDTIEILAGLDNTWKFDVIIADPPYNIGKDFGVMKDWIPIHDYVDWCKKWIDISLGLLKDDGLLYIYGFSEILARVAVQYPVDQQRWLVWHYTNKAIHNNVFWQRSHESILCLWKPGCKKPALEIEQIREPYAEATNSNFGKKRSAVKSRYGKGNVTWHKDHGGALPRDVLKVPALAGGGGSSQRWFMCRTCGGGARRPETLSEHVDCDTFKHPTQKPFELTRRLIQSRVKFGVGGSVLVPFLGSGSECVMAKKLGVKYVGIDINHEYVEFAQSWLDQTQEGVFDLLNLLS